MKVTARMPRVADSTDQFLVQDWHVSVGDRVSEGDTLFDVETDKAIVAIPAPMTGRLVEQLVDAETEVVTGQPIAVLEVD